MYNDCNLRCGICFCRRERDNSEAERAQHLQKIHDLQEHVQEKEQQFLELQEQVFHFVCLEVAKCPGWVTG